MCGRFEIHSTLEMIATVFQIKPGDIYVSEHIPNYNIAPTNDIIMVLDDGKRKLIRCRWGFVPQWARDMSEGYKMINARAETVSQKPAFREAFKNHRCLVVADGFYEWRKGGKIRQPVYIRMKSGRPFGFAGLYSHWRSPDDEIICTSTIITTDSNEAVAPIHPRMPVIIPEDKCELWLDPKVQELEKLTPLLVSYPSADLELYDVTPAVNSPKNNTPENIKPIRQKQDFNSANS